MKNKILTMALILGAALWGGISTRAASTDTWVGSSGNNFSTTANWTYSSGSGPVATGDSLAFAGAGSLTPNNDETSFTFGGITFSGTALYVLGGNPFTIASGGIIANSGAVVQTINNNIALTGTGMSVNPSASGSTITLGGIISGNANYTKGGVSSSTNILNGVNTFSGVLTFNAGTVIFSTPPSALGGNLGNPSGITFGGSSTTTLLTSASAGSVTISAPTITANTSSTALFKNGAATGTTFLISAKITGAGNCKQNTPITSGAIVRFGGDNSDYTGAFSTAAGVIEFTSVANGGSPSSLGAGSTAYAIVNSSSAVTFRYAGAGVSTTTRNIDWQGTTGGMSLDSGVTASGPVVAFLGSGNLRSSTTGATTLTLTGSSTGTNTLAQVINDATSGGVTTVSKTGTGMWVLTGVETFSGGLGISAGTLDFGGTTQTIGAVTFSGASTTQNGTINGASFSGTESSGVATVSAILAGVSAPVTNSGAGTLALLGANTFGGGLYITGAGTVIITNDAGLGTGSGGVTFNASGVLATTNYGAAASNNVTVSSSRTITVASAMTANFDTLDTNNLTIASKITGAGAVTRKGSSFMFGAVRFSGDTSDYTGDFSAAFGNTEFTSVADQGTPSSLGAGASGTGGTISINNSTSSGTLRYVGSGNSVTHRPLNWTGSNATYTVDASGGGTVQFLSGANLRSGINTNAEFRLRGTNTGSNVFGQVINDPGTGITWLNKFDAGTWVLTAANTFSGTVTNEGGTLLINGSIGGAGLTNFSTATLGGTGTINCPVLILSGGFLAPGPGSTNIGTLTLKNTLTLEGTASMTINRTNSQTASLVTGISTVNYGGTLLVSNTGPTLQVGDAFTLFTATNYMGSFTNYNLPSLSAGLAWDTSQLATNGSVQVAALPPVDITGLVILSDGTAQISFAGSSGQNYLVQATTNMALPVVWTTLSTNTADTNGLFQYNDLDSTNFTARFYRTSLP